MLNWRTIGGTIEINRKKLLKCSKYSSLLNYVSSRTRLFGIGIFIQIQKNIWRNLFLTHIWVEFGTREFTKSLITDLDPAST